MTDLTPLIAACFDFTGPLEGNVLWPYLDNADNPNVTIGRGELLYSDQYAANVLGVDLAIVQPQLAALRHQKPGLQASAYEGTTSLRITREKSDDLFRTSLHCHILNCLDHVPGFLDLPREVQIACQDVDFNVKGGIRKFPAMLKAIEARDWARVIQESDRPQLPARSEAVRKLLQSLVA